MTMDPKTFLLDKHLWNTSIFFLKNHIFIAGSEDIGVAIATKMITINYYGYIIP